MKGVTKIVLVAILGFLSLGSLAQIDDGFTHQGGIFFMATDNDTIFVNGDFTRNGAAILDNNAAIGAGNIFITGDINNTSAAPTYTFCPTIPAVSNPCGVSITNPPAITTITSTLSIANSTEQNIYLVGDNSSTISANNGNDTIWFHNLIINKNGTEKVTMNTTLIASGKIELVNGVLDLNGNVLDLKSFSTKTYICGIDFIGETNSSYVTDNSANKEGYIISSNGNYNDFRNSAGLGLTLSPFASTGPYTLIRRHKPLTVGEPSTALKRYYEFTCSNGLASITPSIAYLSHERPSSGTPLNIYGTDGSLWENYGGNQTISPVTATSTLSYGANTNITLTLAEPCSITPIIKSGVETDVSVCAGEPITNLIALDASIQPFYKYIWSDGVTTSNATAIAVSAASATPSPLIYNVTVYDTAGCIGYDNISVMVNPNLTVTASADSPKMCQGQSMNLHASLFGGAAYNYSWSGSGISNPSAASPVSTSNLSVSNFTVTVTEQNTGCKGVGSTSFNVYPYPTPSIGATNVCLGEISTFSNSTTPTSFGLENTLYLWNFGDNQTAVVSAPVNTYSTPGNYVVTMTATIAGCSVSSTVTAAAYDTPTVTLGNELSLCTGVTVTLGNSAVSGGTTPFNYLWSTGSVLSTINTPTPGAYSLSVSDNNLCSGSSNVNISVTPLPIADAGTSNAICNGETTNIGGLPTAIGGTSPYTYLWSPSIGLNSNTIANPQTGANQNYRVTVTDSKGCTDESGPITITVNPNVTPTFTTTPTVAYNNSTVLTCTPAGGIGAYSYIWGPTNYISGLNTTSSITTTLLTVTEQFNVTVTDNLAATSCTGTANVVVSVIGGALNDFPVASASELCLGESITLTIGANYGATPYTYNWSTAENTDVINVTPTITGLHTYSFTVSDPVTTITDSFTVTVHDNPTANALGTPAKCSGETVSLGGSPVASGGSSPYTYQWTGPNLSDPTLANPISSTTITNSVFNVTVVDNNNCFASDVVSVTIWDLPVLDAGASTAICDGQSYIIGGAPTANGGLTPYTYNWSPALSLDDASIANPTSSATGTTTYTLVVSDNNSCSSSASTVLTVNPSPIANAGNNRTICNGYTTALGASPTALGGITPYTYSWSSASFLDNGAVASPIATTSITTAFNLTLEDGNNCFDYSTVTITVNSLPIAELGPTVTIPYGTYTTLISSVTPAASNYSYNWSPVSQINTSTNQSTITTNQLNSNQLFNISVTDGTTSCVGVDQVLVEVVGSPIVVSITPYSSAICSGASTTITAQATGGASNYTYLWSNGETAASITVTTANTYTVTATDSYNDAIASSTVTVNPVPIVVLPTGVTCGVSLPLINTHASASQYSYVWNDGSTTDIITAMGNGLYEITATNVFNCETQVSLSVTLNSIPTLSFGNDSSVCDKLILNGSELFGGSYLWNTGQTTQIITGLGSGYYSVTSTDINSCTVTDGINITVSSSPTVTITSAGVPLANQIDLCDGNTITLDAQTSVTQYLWSTNSTSSSIIIGTEDNYLVTVTDVSNGCIAIDSLQLNILALPDFSNFVDVVSCNEVALSITDANTQDYLWSTGATSASITVTGIGNSTISLAVTTTDNCSDSKNISVTLNASTSIDLGLPIVSCAYNPVTLTTGASSFASYQWSTNETTPTIDVTNSGEYFITITDINNCSSIDSLDVTINPIPMPNYTAQPVCEDAAVNLWNLSTGAATYTWEFGDALIGTSNSQNATYTYADPGNYNVTLTATSAALCNASVSYPIDIYAKPISGLTPVTSATNDTSACLTSLVVNASNGAISTHTYYWNQGLPSQAINTLNSSGQYTVMIISAEGCIQYDTLDLTLYYPFSASIGSDYTSCDIATLDASHPNSSYLWSSSSDTDPTLSVTVSNTYTITVTDQYNCVDIASVSVTIVTSPSDVELGLNGSVCVGDSITFQTQYPSYAHLWSSGSSNLSYTSNITETIFVTVTDNNQCIGIDTVQMFINETPTLDFGNDPVIVCDSYVLNAMQNNASYVWNTGSLDSAITITDVQNVEYSCTVTIGSCSISDAIDVTVNPLPIIDLGSVDTVGCSYDDILLSAYEDGIVNYSWNDGSQDSVLTVSSSGNYTVEITDANSCSSSDSIEVNIYPPFTVDIGDDRPICVGSDYQLDIDNSADSYQWYDSNGLLISTEQNVLVSAADQYTLIAAHENTCIAYDTINILQSDYSLVPEFLVNSDSGKAGDTIIFVNLTEPQGYNSVWTGVNSIGQLVYGPDTSQNFIWATNAASGDYVFTLVVSNAYCDGTVVKDVTIKNGRIIEPGASNEPIVINSIINTLLYPNPNNGRFILELELSDDIEAIVQIFNLQGSLINQSRDFGYKQKYSYQLNDLSNGFYFARVIAGKDSKSLKFVINK